MKIIGKRLRELRVERGLTQQGLAARVSGGLDYTYLGKIERGEQFPSLKILTRIASALGVPRSYFFREEEEPGRIAGADPAPLPGGKAGEELIRALGQLDPADVPLATAIIKALNQHRLADFGLSSAAAPLPRAAEQESPYGEE